VLAGYVMLQLVYTAWLKRIPLVDIMFIAAGFVMRAVTGALAVSVPISPWLLLCTFLLALFLALCKRRHEKNLLENGSADKHRAVLEKYDPQLMDQLITIVAACTILAYSIYTLLPETVQKFGTHALGITIPLVIFGIFRYLDLVYRHGKGGQPEKILLTDLPLLASIALFGLTVLTVIKLA
jgi:4-hydroxybenzoate polyprenyltransferase